MIALQSNVAIMQHIICNCAIWIIITVRTRDVKFVFFPNSNSVCKIRILFELRLGLWYLVFSRTFW